VQQDGRHVAVVRRWAELWSTGDLEAARHVFAPDLFDHRLPPARDIRGIDQETQFIAWVRSAFPDLRVEVEDMVASGNRAATRVTHRGTHRGTFLGIAPTGRPVEYEGTVIFRIADGRIAERWGTVDLFAILWQLGVPILPRRHALRTNALP
jgi:steroid delta-isomerase-like uncharacterized protein